MQARVFHIKACHNLPPESNWREQLIGLLGSKPRRLSRWCELGMFGALSCLKKSGQFQLSGTQLLGSQLSGSQLSSEVSLRVYSEYGTITATRSALEQACESLPMPFTFMQTQPGQLFNALGTAIGWHGDGYSTAYCDRQRGELALLYSFAQSALLAWVDEELELISRWIWLEDVTPNTNTNSPNENSPNKNAIIEWRAIDSIFQTSAAARWLKVDAEHNIFEAY